MHVSFTLPKKTLLLRHRCVVTGALEDIEDGMKERGDELTNAMDKADGYHQALHSILSWLPAAEEKLGNMEAIATEPRSVRIQIEEMKVWRHTWLDLLYALIADT